MRSILTLIFAGGVACAALMLLEENPSSAHATEFEQVDPSSRAP